MAADSLQKQRKRPAAHIESWTTMTPVKPLCWFGSARVFSQLSSTSLPHENTETSCPAFSGSGAERANGRDPISGRIRPADYPIPRVPSAP